MPRTKGSKNKKSLTVDYAALIAQKQAEKDLQRMRLLLLLQISKS